MSPRAYLTSLRDAGFRLKTVNRRPIVAPGTTQTKILANYTACCRINGHIIAIVGNVHQVADEVHVTADLLLTATLEKKCRPLMTASVTKEQLKYLLSIADVAAGLAVCEDYSPTGGQHVAD